MLKADEVTTNQMALQVHSPRRVEPGTAILDGVPTKVCHLRRFELGMVLIRMLFKSTPRAALELLAR
jgi:hypothetical protein